LKVPYKSMEISEGEKKKDSDESMIT